MNTAKLLKNTVAFIAIMVTGISVFSQSNFDIEKTIQGMTLEQKIEFIGGYKEFNIRGNEQLGIPEIHIADGPVGVRNFGKTTAYPASINLAASFDKDIAYRIGKSLGLDARSKNTHLVLGPGMNIYRMPICGRNFEYLGEDPYLAGQLAKQYIVGLQDQGVMACAKHYAANNQEFNRHHCSSDMDERTLHEIYLPAFKTAVTDAKVATVMSGYNLINGIHASQHNYLNNTILKGSWAFNGFIVSDWVSTYDGVACANGGLDLEMPSGAMMKKETLIPAIEKGELDVATIDDKIRRILNTYQRFGFFENPDLRTGFTMDSDFVRETALDASRGGMVLLKNGGNILPLNRDSIKNIVVIGPNGDPLVSGGGGSSWTQPLYPISLLEAIKEYAGNYANVTYEKGIFTGVDFPSNLFDTFNFYVYQNGQKVIGADAEFFNGKKLEGKAIYKKFYPKLNLSNGDLWDAAEVPEVIFSARFTCFFTPTESGYYSIGGLGDDGYRILLDGVQVVDMWRDQGPTSAKYDVFMNGGQEYKVVVEYYQSGGGADIKLGAVKVNLDVMPEQYTSLAMEAAKKADVVIMAVGFNASNESEAFDRTFELPYNQAQFINEIAKANKNIVVVLNSGGNVEMDSWIANAKALLMAWYPGQEGNMAAAEILFGVTNPSGKLPASFEYKIEDNPCYNSYFDTDDDKRVFYNEGIFMGYRYWDKALSKPRFPFGYGLSYTTFEYSNLKVEPLGGNNFTVSVDVKNTGNTDGAEVVQLYVGEEKPTLPRPVKELKAFGKEFIKMGETKTLILTLDESSFSYWSPDKKDWTYNPGKFNLYVGTSSADIKLNGSINIE